MKRLFVLLFALVVLVGVMVMPASAATKTATCQHCGSEDVVWYSLNEAGIDAGYSHYYLSDDLPLTAHIALANKNICLDLNGYTLTGHPKAFLLQGTTTLSIMDTSADKSGQVIGTYVTTGQSGGAVFVNAGCELNIYGGTFSYDATDGNAVYGGVIFTQGTVNMYDGTILGGKATHNGGAVCLYDANSALNVYGGKITAGTADADGNGVGVGDCVAAFRISDGTVKVGGNAQIDEIYYSAEPNATTFQTVAKTDAFAFTGGLVINENKITTYDTMEKAIANVGTGSVMLSEDVETLHVSQDVTIDLNGKDITALNVTGGATVKLKDRKTDDYDCADGDYGVVKNISGNAVAADHYLAVTDTEGTSYHAYSMKLASVTLRPGRNGMYYTSEFNGDAMVASQVESFGTALRIGKAPDANSMRPGSYSAFAPEDFGGESNSTILVDILKKANILSTNQYNASLKVYGRAYIKLTDGSYLFTAANEAQAFSLKTLMEEVSKTYSVNELMLNEDLMEMYRQFSAVMSGWDIKNIEDAYTAKQEEDDQTTNILLIGNSSCYYWTDELWSMMDAAGYKDVNIYNLYYSGASLQQHYNWWKNDETPCQLICHNAQGRTVTQNMNLKYALAEQQWDHVSILPAASNYRKSTTAAQVMETITPYLGEILELVKKNAPNAKLYWQESWGSQLNVPDYDRTNMVKLIQEVSPIIADTYDLEVVPLSGMWEEVRDLPVFAEPGQDSGWEKFTLFTRISDGSLVDDSGHDGDVGGGQYLNACAFYEAFTGLDCRKNTFRPKYTYNSMDYSLTEEEIGLLQNAAHNAGNTGDEALNILLIGNSSCYYWTDEFWSMLDAVGYENVNVYNLYYGGASLEQHYNWWKNDETPCQLICHNAQGRTVTQNMNIKYALAEQQWDYVSFLQASKYYLLTPEEAMATITPYFGELLSLVKEKAPNAKIHWQESWASEFGYVRADFTMDTLEEQTAMASVIQQVSAKVAETYGLTVIPLSGAWQSVRNDAVFAQPGENSGMEKFTLCTRISNGSLMDDFDHDGDVGGGQYLNACIFYEVFTGLDCRKNTFRPEYTYNDMDYSLTGEEISILQNAAHNAVHPEDETMNILLIGNSSCYYWTDELWGMLDAAGYENVNVYNLYSDGASLQNHYTWVNNGTHTCQLICVNENGRKVMNNMNVEDALSVQQWDYVSILQTSKYYLGLEAYAVDPMDSITPYLGELLALIREKAPNARLYWQAGWAYELGHVRSYFTMDTEEKRTAMANRYKETGRAVSEKYGLPVIPLYDAWESVRDQFVVDADVDVNVTVDASNNTELKKQFTLCTRIKSGMLYDDLSHDGDVGGGQYLNACVVYEMLTGKDCRENTFRPQYTYNSTDYSLTGEEIDLLQTAAHNGVQTNS